jgi:NAD(P)-dependent dehydrogenase (short-subunit alcohol dehydrogenase family)
MKKLLLFLLASLPLFASQQVVLITGANGGIGMSTVKAFEQSGWKVWAGYRTDHHQEDSENVRWTRLDVTDQEMIDHTFKEILAEDGKIDALINNAGVGIIGLDETVSIAEAEELFDVNFFGPLRLIQKALPYMQAQKTGHIINISGAAGLRALPGLGIYSASKFALEGLSESLSATLSPWNIKVSIVEPGSVNNDFLLHCKVSTSLNHPFANKFSENFIQKLVSNVTKGQHCDEIGRMIVEIAENPEPNMRYQTSSKAVEIITKKFSDHTGNKMREEQIKLFRSFME